MQCSRDTRDTPHVYSSGGLVKGGQCIEYTDEEHFIAQACAYFRFGRRSERLSRRLVSEDLSSFLLSLK